MHKTTIIGAGRFGKLLLQLITQHGLEHFQTQVGIYDQDKNKLAGLPAVDLETALQSDVLIFAVPISALRPLLQQFGERVNPQVLVVDVCSVKVLPVRWMQQLLPASVQIYATHPVWGPDSVRENDGIWGLKVVVCPVRVQVTIADSIHKLLTKVGLEVEQMSPEEHDKRMARSLVYTHLIGRIGERVGIKPTGIDSLGFQLLQQAQNYVVNDSMQLFRDMNAYNPFAAEMRKDVLQALQQLDAEVAEYQSKIPDLTI